LNEFVSRLVEGPGEVSCGDRHAHALTESLSQWAGRHFDAGGESVLGVARRDAAKLTEILDVIERNVVARQMEQRIKEHRTMPARKDEAVTSHPFRVAGIMAQVTRPQSESHGRGAHRQPGMPGIGLLNGIRRKKTNGVDRAKLKVVCHIR
jgi:hypothetical protein